MASPSSKSPIGDGDLPEGDPTVDRILDAALELFAEVSVRKTTLEDIAKRAGVDRVTVYRRLGSKNDVVQHVMARESRRIFERIALTASSVEDPAERVARGFAQIVVSLRDHPLYHRMIRTEPEATLPRVTREAGDLLAMAVTFAAEHLVPEQPGPRDLDAQITRIEIVVRVIHSLVMTQLAVVDLSSEKKLAAFARDYIAPIVNIPSR
ncbi:TetR/AcrR family transcriptional regulator [Nocardioides humilatus]|uniref:TetR/AcrR family transcriptional regulator n=1 Tax=Nocardioides humilatus TaxID=2607660 RepID=A0A5B1L8J1_9ACTN|nr:TetR/AcrR family transcriptional regulator [Nocardioides humilatus]KAA1416942.1 TetR/AcrR family transcriptional regulator [Nocardioides humilatus]